MTSSQSLILPTNLPNLRWMGGFQDTVDFWGGSIEPAVKDDNSRPNQCYRIYVPDEMGAGYWEAVEFHKGFGMAINNANFHETKVLSFQGEDLIKFHFRLQARSSIFVDPLGHIELDGAACQVFYHPRGVVDYEWIDVGPVDSWISIYCTPAYLFGDLGFEPDFLPTELSYNLTADNPQPYIAHLPVSFALRQCMSQIMQCPYTGAVRSTYLEAQALQLLCETYAELKTDRTIDDLGLSERDVKAIHEAYNILQENYRAPPNVAELSRIVAINRNKLLMGFKSLFGMTLQDFSLHRRMDIGKKLLLETDDPVSRIAEQVGYDHPNNFSSAFKRVYGISPTLARTK